MTNEVAKSTAVTAKYGFASALVKDGEGMGIHVSLIPQTSKEEKLNFFLRVEDAVVLARRLRENLDFIYSEHIDRSSDSSTRGGAP